jgi:2-polyprenyl-3-methyl-5-hydroxy-6-metoxy-1,4-benzoquinol methylase
VSLTTQERETYEAIWSSVEPYATVAPGEQFARVLLEYAGTARGTVLDAGCGSGKGGVVLANAGFNVTLCDLTDAGLTEEARALPFYEACLWQSLKPVAANKGFWGRSRFDYTFCCDVLEHIDPALTMLVVARLLEVTKRAMVVSVSCVPDNFGVWVGRPLHLTIQPFVWWRDHLRELGRVVDARDLLSAAVFTVEPR